MFRLPLYYLSLQISRLHSCLDNIVVTAVELLGHVPLFATPWTIACQALLGKNIEVGCYFLLQRIFLPEGSNPCLLHWQVDSLQLRHLGSQTEHVLMTFQITPLSGSLLPTKFGPNSLTVYVQFQPTMTWNSVSSSKHHK